MTRGMIHVISWITNEPNSLRHIKSISITNTSLSNSGSLSTLDYFEPYVSSHPYSNSTCKAAGGLRHLLFSADTFVAIHVFPAFTLPLSEAPPESPVSQDYDYSSGTDLGRRKLLATKSCTSDVLQCKCTKILEATKVSLLS